MAVQINNAPALFGYGESSLGGKYRDMTGSIRPSVVPRLFPKGGKRAWHAHALNQDFKKHEFGWGVLYMT